MFSLLGALIALYLLLSHLSISRLICPIGGCEKVQGSAYSKILEIPVAAYGFLVFTALLCLSIFGVFVLNRQIVQNTILLVSSLGVMAYLAFTYLEAYVIQAWCFWCVASSLMMFGIWVIAIQDFIGRKSGLTKRL